MDRSSKSQGSYRCENLLDREHVKSIVPKDASQEVFINLGGRPWTEQVDQNKLEGLIPLLTELVLLLLAQSSRLIILLELMTELPGFENSLIEGVEEPQEHIELLRPVEHETVLVLLREVGD